MALQEGKGGLRVSIPDVPERDKLIRIAELLQDVGGAFLTLHQSDAELIEGIEDEVDAAQLRDEAFIEVDAALAEIALITEELRSPLSQLQES